MKLFIILALAVFGYCDRMDDDKETCFSYIDEIQVLPESSLEATDTIVLLLTEKFIKATESEQKRLRNEYLKNCMIGAVFHHHKYGRISKIMADALLVTIKEDYR